MKLRHGWGTQDCGVDEKGNSRSFAPLTPLTVSVEPQAAPLRMTMLNRGWNGWGAHGLALVYAARTGGTLARMRGDRDIGSSWKEFSPAGIMASGTVRLAVPWRFLDSSHAQRRGSWISGWPCQKSGLRPHWMRRWPSCSSMFRVPFGKYRRTLFVPTWRPVTP